MERIKIKLNGTLDLDLKRIGLKSGLEVSGLLSKTNGAVYFEKNGNDCVVWPENYQVISKEEEPASKPTFTFYHENRVDQAFSLSEEELNRRFLDWLESKEAGWLKDYSIGLHVAFVAEKNGLNSVAESFLDVQDALNSTKHDYLNSLGIR